MPYDGAVMQNVWNLFESMAIMVVDSAPDEPECDLWLLSQAL